MRWPKAGGDSMTIAEALKRIDELEKKIEVLDKMHKEIYSKYIKFRYGDMSNHVSTTCKRKI